MKKSRTIKNAKRDLRKKWYSIKYKNSNPGSVGWLIKTEIKYGGLHTGIKRNKVSDKDPRSEEKLKIGGMRGGDRMFHHNYAGKYSKYLLPYVDKTDKIVLVEVGF
ncbi:MAG: hypothetical protein D8M58_12345 [Calditrichaeota bacterium]|nr:MAG: hypothetical protein DWQ03_13130 [Calditrichota bacterium]MBL1206187.1 hypothetical protein [Calditrichota bacterium]NOG46011.1 hypothetical protein [Calditrichota bacterium]